MAATPGSEPEATPRTLWGINLPHLQPSKLRIIPLAAVIFFEVSGGPVGIENSVAAAGPLLAILGFCVFPFVWCIPEALMTAELATAFAEDSGYVAWVNAAFGEFWGFQEGWWSWVSGVADNALYPVLMVQYARSLPLLSFLNNKIAGHVATLGLTVLLTFVNWLGLSIVGFLSVSLAGFVMVPFLVFVLAGASKVNVDRLSFVPEFEDIDWRKFLNILFWNLNYWDSAATLAGEVETPKKTWPKALSLAAVFTVAAYLLPLIVGIGIDSSPDAWKSWDSDTHNFVDIARAHIGDWLAGWIALGVGIANMGLFEAEMSSDSFQLLGMAEKGMLPAALATRSRHGTPTLAILLSASGIALIGFEDFEGIIAAENFLYCLASLLEWGAFLRLRQTRPDLPRPYKVPLGFFGCCCLAAPSLFFIVLIILLSSWKTIIFGVVFVFIGLLLPPGLAFVKRQGWVRFIGQDTGDDAQARLPIS